MRRWPAVICRSADSMGIPRVNELPQPFIRYNITTYIY